jgi:hypothetical protein
LNGRLYEGELLENKLTLAQSKREEAAAAPKERTDQALRKVALAHDQVDTGYSNTMTPPPCRTHSAAPATRMRKE